MVLTMRLHKLLCLAALVIAGLLALLFVIDLCFAIPFDRFRTRSRIVMTINSISRRGKTGLRLTNRPAAGGGGWRRMRPAAVATAAACWP